MTRIEAPYWGLMDAADKGSLLKKTRQEIEAEYGKPRFFGSARNTVFEEVQFEGKPGDTSVPISKAACYSTHEYLGESIDIWIAYGKDDRVVAASSHW